MWEVLPDDVKDESSMFAQPVSWKYTFVCDLYLNWKDVTLDPGPLVHQVLDGNAELSQGPSQFGDPTGPVADGDRELNQAAVGSQAAFQTATQYGCVDVASAKKNDDTKKEFYHALWRN